MIPPLVRQAQSLWVALPGMFERAQQFLISRGYIAEHLTLREAVAKTPGTGGDAA